jgi:hypothetical protein
MNKITNKHAGKRVLIREKWYRTPTEVTILEVTPSGIFFKARFPGGEQWREIEEWELVEELP